MRISAHLAEFTPASRDRYVDLLRVVSLAVVIVGHWLMAVVIIGRDGSITATNILAMTPSLQPVTWLLQVMPIFFVVGGFSHAVALRSLRRRGGDYPEFVRSRTNRLLRPTVVFVGIWLTITLVAEATGHESRIMVIAARIVAQPLWFIGVYLGVVALAPVMERWHRWLGAWSPLAPVVLAVAAGAVDVARLGFGVPDIGYLNVALVWLATHQLGFLYADGTLIRAGWRVPTTMAVAGFGATLALTALGPYPVSLIGVPGERMSNMSPPTVALLAQAIGLTGLVLLLRAPVSRWLARPRVWARVVIANGLTMTAFLWPEL